MKASILLLSTLLLSTSVAAPVLAQNYPTKPIRILIAQAPGSATDVISRVVANRLSESLGQPIVIEARPGAGGVVGTEAAARSAPDGYTLFMANNSTHGSNPAVYPKLPYDAVNDFAPIAFVASVPYVLVVNPSLPVKSVQDLTALAKNNGGKFPADRVISILRGEATVTAHGNRDMPVWGPVFWKMSQGHPAEMQQRITNLTHYLESLQAK